jgi:hypothetical protein
MRGWLIILFGVMVHHAAAQYPFEKFPAVKNKEYKGWKMDTGAKQVTGNVSFSLVIPHFFGDTALTLRLVSYDSPQVADVKIYKGKKQIQKMRTSMSFLSDNLVEPVIVADVNGDGLTDVKLIVPSNGCGLAGLNVAVIYLFQERHGKFTMVSFSDKLEGTEDGLHANRRERDMDGDGNYEIITMDLRSYKTHNYWTFNIYNYKDNALVNVNEKFNYPIMVQYLYRSNYTPADIDKKVLRKYSLTHPDGYEMKK